jgi:Cdc6-like AAA superfamily ATPase
MNSGAYHFTNPLQQQPHQPPAERKNIIVYTGPDGSGKTWQAQMYARTRKVDYVKNRINWSEMTTRLALFRHIHTNFIASGYLFLEEYPINDEAANKAIAQLAMAGFKIIICAQEEPRVTLPDSFMLVKCGYCRNKTVPLIEAVTDEFPEPYMEGGVHA